MRAVVFDLFGTLVTYPPNAPHVRLMAKALGVEFEALHRAWRKLRPERDAGLDTLAALRICCDELGLHADDEALGIACREVAEFFRDLLTPRAGAPEVMRALRGRGLRIGVVTDANVEVPGAWPGSALAATVDAAVFSCEERVRKPDPRLYQAICDRLDVAAVDCLYVGNGDGDELAGALRSGMRAVLFTAPGEYPGRDAAMWHGPRISDLAEVLAVA